MSLLRPKSGGQAASASPVAPIPLRARPLILLIDDEPDLCRIMELALRDAGFDVEMAHDGVKGLELIRAIRPSLVMLDIRMPRMNGYQMLAKLQQDDALAATPVIMITVMEETAQYSAEEWARRLGVKGFITKPFEADAAVAEVRRALG